MLRLYKPRTSQPQEAVEIDWQKSISQGLASLLPLSPASGFRDLVSGQSPTTTGAVDVAANSHGLFRNFGASKFFDYANAPDMADTTPATVAWTQEPRSVSGDGVILNVKLSGAGGSFLIYQSTGSSAYYFTAGPRIALGAHQWASIGAPVNNVRDAYVLTAASGLNSITNSDWELYRNGVLIAGGTSTSFAGNTSAGFRVGALIGATSNPWEGLIGDVHIWSRVLSVDERIRWSRNVNSAYVDQTIWVPVSAGGGAADLVIQSADSAHTSDNLALTLSTSLAIADAAHAHSSENATLSVTGSTDLTAQDAAHAHTADNLALTLDTTLTASDAAHVHTSDGLTLSVEVALTVADAAHAHTSDNVTLSDAPQLAVQDAVHAQISDAPALTLDSALTVQDVAHAHQADAPALSLLNWLAVADAWHVHLVGSVVLTLPGEVADPVLGSLAGSTARHVSTRPSATSGAGRPMATSTLGRINNTRTTRR